MDFFHRAQGKVWMGFSSPTRLCGWDGRTDGAGGGNNLLRHAQFDSDPDPDSFKRRNTAARRRPTQANPVMSASLFWFGRSLDFYFSSCRLPLYTPPSSSTEFLSPSPAITQPIVDANAHAPRPYRYTSHTRHHAHSGE